MVTLRSLWTLDIWIFPCADWQMPSELPLLKQCGLQPGCVPLLLHLRAAFIVQLLVTIAGSTAKNLQPLFLELQGERKKDHIRALRDLDTCLLSQENLCTVWQAALNNILTFKTLDPREVLATCKIKPVTPAAIKLLDAGGNGKPDAIAIAETAEGNQDDVPPDTVVLTMNELLKYGFDKKDDGDTLSLSSAHALLKFQLHLQSLVLAHADAVEQKWRDSLVVKIDAPQDDDGTSARKRASTTKAEILLRLPDDAPCLHAANDANVLMYRLPKDFKMVFFGTVGCLVQPVPVSEI